MFLDGLIITYKFVFYSSIAQSVERMTVNHDVVGSSPTWGVDSQSAIVNRKEQICACTNICERRFARSAISGLDTWEIFDFEWGVKADRWIIIHSEKRFGSVVKRLRHRPFTAVTRVRFPSESLPIYRIWRHSQAVRRGSATPWSPVQIWLSPLKS